MNIGMSEIWVNVCSLKNNGEEKWVKIQEIEPTLEKISCLC